MKQTLFVLLMLTFAALACGGTSLNETPHTICPTAVPPTVLPGTPAPIPPTPVIITAPQDFYIGDAVTVGAEGAALRVQFRLMNVQSYAAAPDDEGNPRRVYAWQLMVSNLGGEAYAVFPAFQMYASAIATSGGEVVGVWGASKAAADEAELIIDNDLYTLLPGEVRVFRLAAYGPAGSVRRFTFTLDPNVTEGSDVITWLNEANPYCPSTG
jgi:hypothetical protein